MKRGQRTYAIANSEQIYLADYLEKEEFGIYDHQSKVTGQKQQNVYYYNVIKQPNGKPLQKLDHAHVDLVIRAEKAEGINSLGEKQGVLIQGNYGAQKVTTNVYTTWKYDPKKKKSIIESQIVQSENINEIIGNVFSSEQLSAVIDSYTTNAKKEAKVKAGTAKKR